MVDFPDPEGPDITIGRCFWVAEGVILEYWSEQQEVLRSEVLVNNDAERINAALLIHRSIRKMISRITQEEPIGFSKVLR